MWYNLIAVVEVKVDNRYLLWTTVSNEYANNLFARGFVFHKVQIGQNESRVHNNDLELYQFASQRTKGATMWISLAGTVHHIRILISIIKVLN